MKKSKIMGKAEEPENFVFIYLETLILFVIIVIATFAS